MILLLVWLAGAAIWVVGYMRLVSRPFMEASESFIDNDATILLKQTDAEDYVKRIKELCDDADGASDVDASDELATIASETAFRELTDVLHDMRIPLVDDFFVAVPNDAGDAFFVVADSVPKGEEGARDIGELIATDRLGNAMSVGSGAQPSSDVFLIQDNGIVIVLVAYLNGYDASSGCLVAVENANVIIRHVILDNPLSLALLVISLFSVILALYLFLRLKIVDPIGRVGEAAKAYLRDHLAGKTDTTHLRDLELKGDNELTDLVEVMGQMETDIATYEQDLIAVTAKQERVNAELEMAANIQATSLPNKFPAFPDRREFDIFASMSPAKEVGGDFYDFFLLDEDHLCMVIADVSNKGVPAALFMMTSKAVLASCARQDCTPAEAMADANSILCSNNDATMFVTVWLGVLQISTGKLVTANAGHEYPVVKQPDGDFELVHDVHGLVAGGMEGMPYTDCTITLQPGAKLFVYTDGLPEASNADGQMFGLDRMVDALCDAQDGTPEQILGDVRRAVDAFVLEEEQFDDLTMLCLEYRGPDGSGASASS